MKRKFALDLTPQIRGDFPPTLQGITDAIWKHIPHINGVAVTENPMALTFKVGLRFKWWVRFVPYLSRYLKNRCIRILEQLIPMGIGFHVVKYKPAKRSNQRECERARITRNKGESPCP